MDQTALYRSAKTRSRKRDEGHRTMRKRIISLPMLSLRSGEMPKQFRRFKDSTAPEFPTERALYKKYCVACHATERQAYSMRLQQDHPLDHEPRISENSRR
jgi:hypothetical protein